MPVNKLSLVDAAYQVLTRRYEDRKESDPMPFNELLLAVGELVGIEDQNDLLNLASAFYTSLTLDGRFVIKENNTWVLRDHELFANIHIDMNAVYAEDEDEDEEDEDEEKDDEDEDGIDRDEEDDLDLGDKTIIDPDDEDSDD